LEVTVTKFKHTKEKDLMDHVKANKLSNSIVYGNMTSCSTSTRRGLSKMYIGMTCRSTRRGLSTVVTGVIMLSAVAVLGTMIVAWSNSSLFSHQQVLTTTLTTNVNKIKESLMIENVWFNTTNTGYINITLNNVGTIGFNVTEIRLTSSYLDQINSTNVPILPNQVYSVSTNYPWESQPTVPVKVIITTARGNIFKTEAMP